MKFALITLKDNNYFLNRNYYVAEIQKAEAKAEIYIHRFNGYFEHGKYFTCSCGFSY